MSQTIVTPLPFSIDPAGAGTGAGSTSSPVTLQLDGDSSGHRGDLMLLWAARGSAVIILLLLVGLVGVLFVSAIPSIKTFGAKFLVSSDWRPNPLEVAKRDPAG